MSKLKEKPPEGVLVAIIQRLINFKLIKGWMWVEKDVMNHMAKEQLKLEEKFDQGVKAFNLLRLEVQEKENEAAVHEQQTKNAVIQRDAAEKRCLDMDRVVKDSLQMVEEKESEIELAASEILVLKESQIEATALSKQLKEALDRWTS
jgi:FtsZ-binding cell division protein ZapB